MVKNLMALNTPLCPVRAAPRSNARLHINLLSYADACDADRGRRPVQAALPVADRKTRDCRSDIADEENGGEDQAFLDMHSRECACVLGARAFKTPSGASCYKIGGARLYSRVRKYPNGAKTTKQIQEAATSTDWRAKSGHCQSWYNDCSRHSALPVLARTHILDVVLANRRPARATLVVVAGISGAGCGLRQQGGQP